MRTIRAKAVTLFLLCAASPALAASTKERVGVLEGEVAELKTAASAAAAQGPRIDRLEQEIRSLTGRLEEVTYQLDQANTRLEAMSAILAGEGFEDFGPPPAGQTAPAPNGGPIDLTTGGPDPIGAQIETTTPGADAAAGEPGAPGPNDVALPLDPETAFHYANGFVLKRDYVRAERAFLLYRETFADHPRSADAQFRLGEIYLATENYAKAAEAFIAHIREYPDNARAPQAHLKLGAAFARLGQQEEACNVLQTTKSKYADAGQSVIARADRQLRRYQCE